MTSWKFVFIAQGIALRNSLSRHVKLFKCHSTLASFENSLALDARFQEEKSGQTSKINGF